MSAPRGLFGHCALCDDPAPATHRGTGRSISTVTVPLCCHHAHEGVGCGQEAVCCLTWEAPRVEVPMSVWVNHVCQLPYEHEGHCACACGAVLD